MRAVNLLPVEARYRKRWWAADAVPASPKRIVTGGGVLVAVLALSLIAAYLLQRGIVQDRQETKAGLEQKVAVAEAEAAQIRAQQDNATARLAAFTTVTTQRVAWDTVLRDLSRVLPHNAFLDSLTATSPTPVGGGASPPTTFNVTGSTSSQPAVALVLDRLALLPWLSGVTLQSSTRAGAGIAFTISATFVATGRTG